MRRKSNISFGPGAASLILIVVILSMSVLGMLALMNARNDARLSSRSVSVVEAYYDLADQAQRAFAELDGVALTCTAISESDDVYLQALRGLLPSGMLMDGRTVNWSHTDGLRTLTCEAEVQPLGSEARLTWRTHRLTAVTEDSFSWN